MKSYWYFLKCNFNVETFWEKYSNSITSLENDQGKIIAVYTIEV